MPGVLPTPLLTTGGVVTLLYAYNFDEASGAVVDASGNGLNVTLTGSLVRTASGGGHSGTGSDKGLSQSTTAADSAGPTITTLQTAQYTVMAWVKRSSNSLDGWFAELKSAGSGDRGILFLSGAVQSRVRNAAGTIGNVSTTQPTAGTWYHVAGTYDGSKVHLFINGSEIGTGSTLAAPLKSNSTSSSLFDALGSETVIDDLRYYDTALDAATITTLMGTPVGGGGTTPVSATRSTTWRVAAQVTSTRATTFDVLSVATSNRPTTWDVLTGVTATRGTTWDALAPVTSTRATTWRTVARATGTRATTWDVLTPVSATRATTWRARAQVTSTRATTWRAQAQVTGTRATTWRARAQVASSRLTTWRVRSAVTAARSTTWNVASTLTTVVATRATTWGVAGRVTATRPTTWDALVRITTSRPTSWDTTTLVTASRGTTWRVRQQTTATRNTSWRVRSTATATRPTTWDVASLVTLTRIATWDSLATLTAARTTTWAVAAGSSHGPAVQSVLTATHTGPLLTTIQDQPDLTPSNSPSSHLEVSHVV